MYIDAVRGHELKTAVKEETAAAAVAFNRISALMKSQPTNEALHLIVPCSGVAYGFYLLVKELGAGHTDPRTLISVQVGGAKRRVKEMIDERYSAEEIDARILTDLIGLYDAMELYVSALMADAEDQFNKIDFEDESQCAEVRSNVIHCLNIYYKLLDDAVKSI